MKLTHVMVLLAWSGFAWAGSIAPAPATNLTPDSVRKASTVYQFRKTHACPATGRIQATCPGYVIDHIIPLCAGGLDVVENMQWQIAAESYKKDNWERDLCRRLKTCTGAKK